MTNDCIPLNLHFPIHLLIFYIIFLGKLLVWTVTGNRYKRWLEESHNCGTNGLKIIFSDIRVSAQKDPKNDIKAST